jgi:leucyl aminopeptidase
MYGGKTVEVLNTDAEGRMILADAMSFAQKSNPKVMIDLATLTGACTIALGESYAGLFGNDVSLIEEIKRAGERSGESVWHLPSGADYLEAMKSKIADLKNVGPREGGACNAAAFLNEFTGGIPWAHLDIACVAKPNTDKPWRSSDATGFGVKLILEYLCSKCLN